ncbi:MAG: LamG domain-containing protein [Candidatus Poribacteria bacterium]|nr:LamG domain-containing protein [Candidatus Poribacteria bacterium]
MKKPATLLLTALAAMLTTASLHALQLDDDDLLLYVSANDENDVVADDSANGLEGMITGNVEWVDGKYGTALGFSESGDVAFPHIPLDSRSFTITMWVNPTLTGALEQCVFSQTQVNALNTSMHFRTYTNATVRMGFYSNDLDAVGAAVADEWQHVAYWLDVDDTLRRIYINGEQVAEDAGKSGINYLGTAGNTVIGSWGATGQRFSGVIGEVQIWNRALSDADIKQSMDELATLSVDPVSKMATTLGALKAAR